MLINIKSLLLWLAFFLIPAAQAPSAQQEQSTVSAKPEYTVDSQLKLPTQYREWVYLTSGFDMSYNRQTTTDHHMFDNVFVNPQSYRSFLDSGTWPDKTLLVLEGRMAKHKGSINRAGHYQSTEMMGIEVHVKDEAHFPGKWAFFVFGDKQTASMVPRSADCYTCHAAHAAVDTTFVQFYPTLLPVAARKHTLSPSYLKESGGAEQR